MLEADTIRAAPKALLHDHLDGGLRPATVIELAAEVGYTELPTTDPDELARWFLRGADRKSLELYLEGFRHTVALLQTPDALERVAAECAEDLAADGVVYAEVRYAPELSTEGGLTLDEVVTAILAGFREGEHRARQQGRRITMKFLVSAMRQAARSVEIAELAVRHRDEGVVGFDIAGPEAGFPPTRHLDAFQLIQRENFHFTIHAGEALRPAVDLGGAAVVRRRAARARRADRRRHHGARRRLGRARAPGRVRPRPPRAARDVPDVATSRRERSPSIEEHPIDLLRRLRYPRHRQHRQPADERRDPVVGVRGRSPTPSGSASTRWSG